MKSMVTFWVEPGLDVGSSINYFQSGISTVVSEGKLTQLQSLVEHDDSATPPEIEAAGREKLRDLLSLLSFGRHSNIHLNQSSIRAVDPPPGRMVAMGLISITKDTVIVNQLQSLPAEELLQRLKSDGQLRRQVEHLNAARNAGADVVERIRWSYMVLEQEKIRGDYQPLDDFLQLRNGVSHAQLDRTKSTAYFNARIGVPFPDLGNASHYRFLASESEKLLREATRIVESHLSDRKFWG